MKAQTIVLALISITGVCVAKGKAWFYTEKSCAGYVKKDKARVHTSGGYPTHKEKCYNDETGRLSFKMEKDLQRDEIPTQLCIRISSGPWCTAQTIGLDVVANDQCYNIPEKLGDAGFAMTSFRLELGPCPGGPGPKFDALDDKTCRWGTNRDL